MLTVSVAGGYQLYFWVQRNRFHRRAVCLKIRLEDQIPFVPEWIWLYSFLWAGGNGFAGHRGLDWQRLYRLYHDQLPAG